MADAGDSGVPSDKENISEMSTKATSGANHAQNPSGLVKGFDKSGGDHATIPDAFETKFFGNFVNPMLSRMEQRVAVASAKIDELQRQRDKDRDEERKQDLSKHIPDAIKGNGQDISDIMKTLEDLIMYYNIDGDDGHSVKVQLKELTPNLQAVLTSYSIAAYAASLDAPHLQQFSRRLMTDISHWLSRLFRLENGLAFLHDEEREGLLRVARLAIIKRYPEYIGNGFEVLKDKPPVLYVSSAGHPGTGHFICAQLGLPVTCLCMVPLYKDTHQMDVTALTKQITEDKEAGKVPVMVVAYAGTPMLGHVDDFKKLHEICDREKIWLHVEGNSISLLSYFTVPTNVRPVRSGDSLSVNLSAWLGISSLSYVTLFRSPERTDEARAAGLLHGAARPRLAALPIWVTLQNLGHYGVVEKISKAVKLAKLVHETVNRIDNLKNVTLFEIENPTVVFRYSKKEEDNPDDKADQSEGTDSEEEDDEASSATTQFLNVLNTWMCDILKRDCPKLTLSVVEVPGEGTCVRFAPMECLHDYDAAEPDVEKFCKYVSTQVKVLDATMAKRVELENLVAEYEGLTTVLFPKWPGVGALQYIPTHLRNKTGDYTAAEINDISNINYELVQHLKTRDTAFSLGKSPKSMFCVRFGLVTSETNIRELVELVLSQAKEIEESSKYLETMAENIRKGIEKAEEDLQKENQEKLVQEGVLRQLPMVGSLLNWWSPPPKDLVKGRMFDLNSGRILSTAETYKHKMQIQQERSGSMDSGSADHESLNSSPGTRVSSSPIAVPNGPASPREIEATPTPGDSPMPSPKGALEISTTPRTPNLISNSSAAPQKPPLTTSAQSSNANGPVEPELD